MYVSIGIFDLLNTQIKLDNRVKKRISRKETKKANLNLVYRSASVYEAGGRPLK